MRRNYLQADSRSIEADSRLTGHRHRACSDGGTTAESADIEQALADIDARSHLKEGIIHDPRSVWLMYLPQQTTSLLAGVGCSIVVVAHPGRLRDQWH